MRKGPPGSVGSPRGWEKAAAWSSIGAAAVHGGIAPQHFREWWGYGLFFVFAATAQVVFGLALLTNAINAEDFGPRWRGARLALLWAGVVGNLVLIVFYVITRTVGIPPPGPSAGERETVAPIDVLAELFEVVVVVACLILVRRRERGAPHPGSSGPGRAEV